MSIVFDLKRTHQLSLLPDKDLVNLCPPIEPYQVTKSHDITGHTLWLLMQAINTENVTFILDSCHSGGARKGILTVRSRLGNRELNRTENSNIQLLASPQEQEYQK